MKQESHEEAIRMLVLNKAECQRKCAQLEQKITQLQEENVKLLEWNKELTEQLRHYLKK